MKWLLIWVEYSDINCSDCIHTFFSYFHPDVRTKVIFKTIAYIQWKKSKVQNTHGYCWNLAVNGRPATKLYNNVFHCLQALTLAARLTSKISAVAMCVFYRVFTMLCFMVRWCVSDECVCTHLFTVHVSQMLSVWTNFNVENMEKQTDIVRNIQFIASFIIFYA